MKFIEDNGALFYQSDLLGGLDWIAHGFGTKGRELSKYLENFDCQANAPQTKQVHGARVHVLDGENSSSVLEGDAFITKSKGQVCFVRTADCVPILLCDPIKKAVGAVHMGWRGAVQNVVGATIDAMKNEFKSNPSDILALEGPAICEKCYTIGKEVVAVFEQNGFSSAVLNVGREDNLTRLNLKRVAFELLKSSGVSKIESANLCTNCGNSHFSSYRYGADKNTRQINFIFIK